MTYIIVISALVLYGFMLFDGIRALVIGDYVRPKAGKYSGQLGPWSKIVRKIGIHPESQLMKWIFVVYGIAGLTISIVFFSSPEQFGFSLFMMSIMTLWYLTPGTILSVLQIILLVVLGYY